MRLKLNKHLFLMSITNFFIFLILFILINLIIGCFKYGGIYSYLQILDNKDWYSSISKFNIKDPLAIFNADKIILDNKNINNIDIIDTKNIKTEIIEDTLEYDTGSQNNKIDPYDPEFEDEFNSFFGGEMDTNDKITTENDENEQDTTIGFVNDDSSVAKELIKKFNE